MPSSSSSSSPSCTATMPPPPSPSPSPSTNRRTLHIPFFPVEQPPQAKPPSTTIPQPFFPFYPFSPFSSNSPSTIPANNASPPYANSNSARPHRRSSLLIPAILLPLLAVALLATAVAFFLYHRRRRLLQHCFVDKDGATFYSNSLVLPDSAHSDGGGSKDDSRPSGSDSVTELRYSMVLRPPPCLAPRQLQRGHGNADGRGSPEEEFYSLSESAAVEKGSTQGVVGWRLASSRRTFQTRTTPSFQSTSSPSPSPSLPVALSAAPPHEGPSLAHSIDRSWKFKSEMSDAASSERKKRQVDPSPTMQWNRVLDQKKYQKTSILLRALNVTEEEVCEALLEGDSDRLEIELLESLLKMAPSKEEELKLKEYKDNFPAKLGPAEKFLKALLNIPFAFKRVDAMLFIAMFDSEVMNLKKSYKIVEAACEELRSSRMFLKLLEGVLRTGNCINVGTNHSDACAAFKIDTLLRLVDLKGSNGKITVLHFVVQEIIRSEGSRLYTMDALAAKSQVNSPHADLQRKKLGLQAVAGLGSELHNVMKAATMDSHVQSSFFSKLAGGMRKINEVIRLYDELDSKGNGQFHDAMIGFLKRAEYELIKVQAEESVALSLVKEMIEYFNGDSTEEEAHPFRIFILVRDFLVILDRVCKEVRMINDQMMIGSEQHLLVPINPTNLSDD